MKDLRFIKKAIQWAENHGFNNLKANLKDYETPTQFISKEGEKTFTPDVTGLQQDKKSYIEIAIKSENVKRKISKWKLLSTLANIKGGKFFLLVPRGHKHFTVQIVKDCHLNAEVVYLKNSQ